MANLLRVSSNLQFDSITDGIGLRCVIWTQGCKHNCLGCHNPQTHDFTGGKQVDIQELLSSIFKHPYLDGVTFSGGEPFEQSECLSIIAQEIKKTHLNLWCYTGYLFEDLIQNPQARHLLQYIDVLVDGPFIMSQRSLSNKFKGSTNQRILDVKKSLEQNCVVLYPFI